MSDSLPEFRGEYKMEGRLGESGSGPVYCARDGCGGLVAIKVLAGVYDAELPSRLRNEASLKHKNILTILALFRNKERICIVTELLEGKDLPELMAEDQSRSLLDRIEIMTQAGEALRYAHTNGIAHRGLKPSQIHVLPDGAVKVRNFSVDVPPEAPQYIPPERAAGQAADALGNIFTFGVILQELTATSSEHPELLAGIVKRAANKDRHARYQSFDELLADVARLLVQLRKTDLHFTGLFESWSAPAGSDSQSVAFARVHEQVHENVQFTVYRPRAVRPGEWKTLLAFAHLSDRSAGAPEDEPDPIKDVQQRANLLLGKDATQYQDFRQDSSMPIPHEGELTFVPEMNGVEFNPRRASFLWQESVHQAAFRLRASSRLDGQTARGQMCVYLGSILVAQVALKIEVNSQRSFQAGEESLAPVTAPRYRKIFASYSHRDVAVVEEFERYGKAMGDEYLRDVMHLRSGEVWNDRLLEMIDQASVFQLFWSSNSIRSPYVHQEWQYALSLNRDCFVRPVFWEDPLPEVRELNLPPEALRSLHFHRVVPCVAAAPGAIPETSTATHPTFQVPVYSVDIPPPPPAWQSPSAQPPAAIISGPGLSRFLVLALQLAAAILIAIGAAWLSLHAYNSRHHPAAPSTPVVNPDSAPARRDAGPTEHAVEASPVIEPTAVHAPVKSVALFPPPGGTPKRYILMLWSRGTPILPDQVVRGEDPLLQSSFTMNGAVPEAASVEVEWFLNGVSAGVTEFDRAEKGKHKNYATPPGDGNYRAVLLVNQEAVASALFSYQK